MTSGPTLLTLEDTNETKLNTSFPGEIVFETSRLKSSNLSNPVKFNYEKSLFRFMG